MSSHTYEKEARSFLHTLPKHGLKVTKVYDGEETILITDTPAIETIMSVSDSWVFVEWETGRTARFWLVFGNSPGELLADWTIPEDTPDMVKAMDAAFTEHTTRWEDC